jgi:hypothetical protein
MLPRAMGWDWSHNVGVECPPLSRRQNSPRIGLPLTSSRGWFRWLRISVSSSALQRTGEWAVRQAFLSPSTTGRQLLRLGDDRKFGNSLVVARVVRHQRHVQVECGRRMPRVYPG